MSKDFRREELYGDERILQLIEGKQSEVRELAGILADRADVESYLLERVAGAIKNQGLNIFLFILRNGPVTRRHLYKEFPPSTVDRYLPLFEGVEVIERHDYEIWVRRLRRPEVRKTSDGTPRSGGKT